MMTRMCRRQFSSIICLLFLCDAIVEPYPALNGGEWQNNSYLSKYSPDPIINYVWKSTSINNSALQIYNVTAKYAYTDKEASFYNLESIYLFTDNIDVTVYGAGNITIDFGSENAAWFEIDSNDCDDIGLTMSISEYNEPWISGNTNLPKTLAPIKYIQNGITTYRLETNKQLYEGVRYGFIHVSSQTNKVWHIIGVRAVSQIKPTNYIGSFQSNKYPILNKIWYSAAYCVKMNMLPSTFGAILMDRGDRIAFAGDNHISHKVALYAFGAFDYVERSIIKTENVTNNILSYELYWVLCVYDFYIMTGNISWLGTVDYKLQIKLNRSIQFFGSNPSINFYGWDDRIGAGFEGADHSVEAQYAYKMLTIQTLGKALIFWDRDALNNMELFNYYMNKRMDFVDIIMKDSMYLNKFGLHSSADAINGMWLTQTDTDYLFSKWYNDSVNICSFSPFNMFFVAQSIGEMNKMDYLLSVLDMCWGNSVRLGATTFWEVFDPHWNAMGLETNDPIPNSVNGMTSECHPWSSGALSLITTYITGFKILKPGCTYIEIKPALLHIKADIPLPYHDKVIHIDFDGYNGEYLIYIPIKMKMDLYLPVISEYVDIIMLFKHKNKVNTGKMIVTDNGIYWMAHFEQLNPDTYKFIQNGSGFTKQRSVAADIPNVFPEAYYPCSIVGEDYDTQGDWIGLYGSNGYILYGFGSNAQNVEKLPSYVGNITHIRGTLVDWTKGDSLDLRALLDPNTPGKRGLGTLYASPTFAVMINIDESKINGTYLMSLYLCDWENINRKQVIRIYDAKTLNIIAPILYNEEYADGKWVQYKLDRSVKIRMNFVRGGNAVLSGIFFD